MKMFLLLSCIFLLSLLLLQCSENPLEIAETQESGDDIYFIKGGNGPGGGGGNPGGGGGSPGGGGHTTTQGNNLSFPAILADGYPITLITATNFTVPYAGEYTGLTAEQIAYLDENGPWYPQQTEGNVWQADFASGSGIIGYIDWGDMIEAVNPKLRRPYRLELVLYTDVPEMMTAYTMAELEFPSSKDELQGTNCDTYESVFAAVASPNGRIVVQRFEGVDPTTLTWDVGLGKWIGAEPPITGFGFAVENNVGGKLIFGASFKGWKPADLGDHRITFYLENSTVDLSGALISNYDGATKTMETNVSGETNTPVVDATNNLTYVDVIVNEGGGGGGGGGGH